MSGVKDACELARALQCDPVPEKSSERDNGAASLHIRRDCAMCRVHLVNGDPATGGPAKRVPVARGGISHNLLICRR